jgi:hypothetical protein
MDRVTPIAPNSQAEAVIAFKGVGQVWSLAQFLRGIVRSPSFDMQRPMVFLAASWVISLE